MTFKKPAGRARLDKPDTMNAPTPQDVRMKGFASRALVEDVWKWVDSNANVLPSETVAYTNAHGRVLAENVIAPVNVPAFDRSAMDGYSLRADETEGAGDYNPLTFSIVGESMPGQPYDGDVQSGQAVRIMTGAPLPTGADAVAPAEYATREEDTVSITAAVSPNKHVGRIGEDVKSGETLLTAGRKLRPQDVGLLASMGIVEVAVVRQPRVRLLVTGNELVNPGEPRSQYQIYESNSAMVTGLVARDGGVLESIRYLPDDRDAIREALTEPGADVLLISGGSSVGAEDHAPSLIAEAGELAIHGVAMRPSSPSGVGRVDDALVFLLPGNPVSCLCAYDFFAGRAIRQLGDRSSDWPYAKKTLPLERKIASAVGRVDYCRVAIQNDRLQPLALSGASILSSTTRADGFVIVPAELEGYAPGTKVCVHLYDAVR